MNFLEIIDPISKLLTNGTDLDFGVKIIIRVFITIILAAFLGIERANKRHAAGLRTFIIVSLAATISSLTDSFLMANYPVVIPAMSAATAIGIAIISSNTILYSSKNQINGC